MTIHVHQELEPPCCPLRRGADIHPRYPICARRCVKVAVDTPYDTVYGLFVECEPTFVPSSRFTHARHGSIRSSIMPLPCKGIARGPEQCLRARHYQYAESRAARSSTKKDKKNVQNENRSWAESFASWFTHARCTASAITSGQAPSCGTAAMNIGAF